MVVMLLKYLFPYNWQLQFSSQSVVLRIVMPEHVQVKTNPARSNTSGSFKNKCLESICAFSSPL